MIQKKSVTNEQLLEETGSLRTTVEGLCDAVQNLYVMIQDLIVVTNKGFQNMEDRFQELEGKVSKNTEKIDIGLQEASTHRFRIEEKVDEANDQLEEVANIVSRHEDDIRDLKGKVSIKCL